MRRQVPDRLLVAGLSFVIREKRRVGLFFSPLSLLCSLAEGCLLVSTDRSDGTNTHTRTHKYMH